MKICLFLFIVLLASLFLGDQPVKNLVHTQTGQNFKNSFAFPKFLAALELVYKIPQMSDTIIIF